MHSAWRASFSLERESDMKIVFFFLQTIPIVHLEDVYITGLCASSCHLRREHDKGFKARPMDKISEYQIQVSKPIL